MNARRVIRRITFVTLAGLLIVGYGAVASARPPYNPSSPKHHLHLPSVYSEYNGPRVKILPPPPFPF